jgi:hypothetical protein
MRKAIFILLLFCGFQLGAATITDTLVINRSFVPLYTSAFYYCAFNQGTTFNRTNTNYNCEVGDSLVFTVINNDTATHSFTIDGFITSSNVVNAGGQIIVTFVPPSEGSYRYYSSLSNGGQLGASGVIVAGYSNYIRYTWNLFDQDSIFAERFHLQSYNAIDNTFHPGVFFINGKTYPLTANDPQTEINGVVGDSIVISIVNSGHMIHSMHFHGYHVKILSAQNNPHMTGWWKDSFPVGVQDHVTILLVPDKEGMYPVHDHNLVATTNVGLYPGGMIAMLNIMP